MKKIICVFLALVVFYSCEYRTEELNKDDKEVTGEIGYFTMESDYENSVDNQEVIMLPQGTPVFNEGMIENTKAVQLDGDNDFLKIIVGIHDTLGVSLWFRSNTDYVKDSREFKPALIDYGYKELYAHVDAYTYATVIKVNYDTVEYGNTGSAFQLSTQNKWTHLYAQAAIGDSSISFYINGRLSDSITSIPYKPLSEMVYIGRASHADDLTYTFYNGMIDEVKIFNKRLSKEEIENLSTKENYLP